MSRRAREHAILEIVDDEVVSNQTTLVELLHRRGFDVTQATVSRDIKRLGLIKRPARRGGYRYAPPGVAGPSPQRAERQLGRACEQFVTKVGTGDALVVLRTLTGRANAVAVALDECGWEEVVGTLAGDDTILVVARDEGNRQALVRRLEKMLGG
ncbi:MAG: arginine repressor [Thermoanaerobaculia bacterium]|nr:arginine repressor [Thermoanaerobaculia bacterium]